MILSLFHFIILAVSLSSPQVLSVEPQNLPTLEECREKFLSSPIDDLELTVKTITVLKEAGIDSIGTLIAKTEAELLGILTSRPSKKKIVREIKMCLAERGLFLKGDSTFDDRNIVYRILKKVFPGLDQLHQYEGEDVTDWPSDWKQILTEVFPNIKLEFAPFIPHSKLSIWTPKEEKVLELRFGLEGERRHTLKEIAQIFNLSSSRIGQVQAKALMKLKAVYDLSRALWLKSILPSNHPDWTLHPEQVEGVVKQLSNEELEKFQIASKEEEISSEEIRRLNREAKRANSEEIRRLNRLYRRIY